MLRHFWTSSWRRPRTIFRIAGSNLGMGAYYGMMNSIFKLGSIRTKVWQLSWSQNSCANDGKILCLKKVINTFIESLISCIREPNQKNGPLKFNTILQKFGHAIVRFILHCKIYIFNFEKFIWAMNSFCWSVYSDFEIKCIQSIIFNDISI